MDSPRSEEEGSRHQDGGRCAKRPPPADSLDLLAKKRRKQLNPSRITMVQVPKHITGLDIDVDNRNEPVPNTDSKEYEDDMDKEEGERENEPDNEQEHEQDLNMEPTTPALFPFVQPLWTERSLKIFNHEAYCELCNKEFCNKYFLKTHKANKHGIYVDMKQSENGKSTGKKLKPKELNPTVQTESTNETGSTLTSAEIETLPFLNDDQEEEQKSPLNLMVGGSEEDKDECSSENLEKLQTMLLRLTPSEAIENADSSEPRDLIDRDYMSDSSGESRPEEGKIRKTKPTSSYCEICNKELCNKYFMRTHMQRMHGIELEHGTQIGGVVCNICNKELCSKYFLRVHKQNTHGVSLLGAPSTSTIKPAPRPSSTSCHVCSKRFRSTKWLQAHLLSDHQEPTESADTPEHPETLISKLFWENTSSSASYTCSQCPFTTSVLAFLFVHERSHFVLSSSNVGNMDPVKPSASLQDLIHDKTFWQHKITQQIPECLDLSVTNSKFLSFDRNGS